MKAQWTSAVSLFFCCIFTLPCPAYEREIVITIDDLPFVGLGSNTPANLKRTEERFMALINALVEHQVPATGFAIGGALAKNEWYLMEAFRNQGFSLGNHTYTHLSLDQINADKYIADIERAHRKLAPIMSEPRYFRYPYLAEGKGNKKQKVVNYLKTHQYTIAPVTIDSKDYAFNARFHHIPYSKRAERIEQFKKKYLAYIWKETLRAEQEHKDQPQILLIHANMLNSFCLKDVIQLYKDKGYKFISLEEALNAKTLKKTAHPQESLKQKVKPPKTEFNTNDFWEFASSWIRA